MERSYYKVEQSNSKIFKDASAFLANEAELIQIQKAAVESRIPEFSAYIGYRGFHRIVRYEGFVFVDNENIDKKAWVTKERDGKLISYPNKRTKVGKEIDKFLEDFKRTTCWDVDRVLGLEKSQIYGSFYPANLFKYKDCIYIMIDSQYRRTFEKNNPSAVEITLGEIEKAIEEYNAQ